MKNYISLNALSKKLRNFAVVAVPCNQFGKQEPGSSHTEIMNGIRYVRPGNNFVPEFPIMMKTDVNGVNEEKLYTFLKCACPAPEPILGWKGMYWHPYKVNDIRWNFEKFLVDKEGVPRIRFSPSTDISTVENYLKIL